MQKKTSTTRRAFLKTTAAGMGALAATAALGAFAGCATNSQGTPVVSADDITWDSCFDVVVVGFGAAGAASALTAADEGAHVLLVDKAPEGSEGGNTRFSSQIFITAQDEQEALKHLKGLSDPFYAPEEVLRADAKGLVNLRDTLFSWGLESYQLGFATCRRRRARQRRDGRLR